MVRHFRNGERPLKLSTAAVYIQQLLRSKKIDPAEGARVWYAALLYNTGMEVVAGLFRLEGRFDPATFERNQAEMLSDASLRFELNLEKSLKKSGRAPLAGYPLNDIRQFLDFCAFLQWQESKIKRSPTVANFRLFDLAVEFNKYTFD